MSKMAELAYDIEQLYIEGLHPTKIAKQLGVPLSMVYDWLEGESLKPFDQWTEKAQKRLIKDIYSPFCTVNS